MAAAWAMVSWLDLAIAAILVAAAVGRIAIRRRRARARDADWLAASARTIGVVERYSISPETFEVPFTHYTPVIVYRAADGHLCQVRGASSVEQEPPLGTEVEIAYRPEAPADARVVAAPEPWSRGQQVVAGMAMVLACYLLAITIAWARNLGAADQPFSAPLPSWESPAAGLGDAGTPIG